MWNLPPLTTEEILLYSRKSRTDDPTLSVEETLAKHEQMMDDWIARNLPDQPPIPEKHRFREVVSGETLDSRPKVQEVLRQVESPRYKAIIIKEPQRLSRGDLEDIGRLVKLLRYSNTIVITMDYIYDLRDERDRDAFERELKRGNEYLEYQKKIMNNGRLLSVQNGNFIGQHAPYGFRKIQIKEGKKKCFTLEPVPEEAQVVKMIFNLYLKGYGAGRIISRLEELAIKPPKEEGAVWAETTIRTMLGNDHYIGKVHWYKKKTVKSVENGVVVSRRPTAEEYLVYPGKHPAIIDQEIFDAVQAKRGKIPRNKKATNLSNPFSGLMFCECGRAISRHTYNHKGKQRAEPRYQCRGQKRCNTASCVESDLLDEVKRSLAAAIADFEVRIEAGEDDSIEIHRQMVERMEKRLRELEALEISQWEKYTLEGMPKHIFDQLNKKVLDEKDEVQQALCLAKGSIPEPVDLEEKITTFRAILDLMGAPDVPVKELNDLLKTCIERITYRRPKTPTSHGRWETGSPIELDIELRV